MLFRSLYPDGSAHHSDTPPAIETIEALHARVEASERKITELINAEYEAWLENGPDHGRIGKILDDHWRLACHESASNIKLLQEGIMAANDALLMDNVDRAKAILNAHDLRSTRIGNGNVKY